MTLYFIVALVVLHDFVTIVAYKYNQRKKDNSFRTRLYYISIFDNNIVIGFSRVR